MGTGFWEEGQLVQMMDAQTIQFAITKEGLLKASGLQELARKHQQVTR
jgi:hypothetical protein